MMSCRVSGPARACRSFLLYCVEDKGANYAFPFPFLLDCIKVFVRFAVFSGIPLVLYLVSVNDSSSLNGRVWFGHGDLACEV